MNTLLEYVDDLINQSSQTKSFWDKHKGKILATSAIGAGILAHKTGMLNFKHAPNHLFSLPSGVGTDRNLIPSEAKLDFSNIIDKGKTVGEITMSGVNKLSKNIGHSISKKYHELFDPSNLEKRRELAQLRQNRDLYRSFKNQASLDKISEKIKNYDS